MNRKSYLGKKLEKTFVENTLREFEKSIDEMENSNERVYINLFNSGYTMNATAIKKLILNFGRGVLKKHLKTLEKKR
jgi:hypothetical protein